MSNIFLFKTLFTIYTINNLLLNYHKLLFLTFLWNAYITVTVYDAGYQLVYKMAIQLKKNYIWSYCYHHNSSMHTISRCLKLQHSISTFSGHFWSVESLLTSQKSKNSTPWTTHKTGNTVCVSTTWEKNSCNSVLGRFSYKVLHTNPQTDLWALFSYQHAYLCHPEVLRLSSRAITSSLEASI